MKLSTRARYGTRFLIHLAKRHEDGFIQLCEIAKEEGISPKYLEQIVIPLKKVRLVVSARGAGGGYRLSRNPKEIKMGEVVAVLEGGRGIIECIAKPESCSSAGACLSRPLWELLSESMTDKLNSITLDDLIKEGGIKSEGRFHCSE